MKKTDLINKTIHGYRVQSFVAEGGMAWVFKAVHEEMNRTVALKMIRPEVRDDAKALERFEYTAKLQARIKHPNIVFVYDFFKEEFSGATRHFLIEEFVDGSSLDDLIRKKNISAEKALQICREVLIGLEAAHKQGVVHRDIKPDNVMIDRTGTAKVTDFGIAKEWRTDSHLTRTRTAIGSPQYMSPEQITSPRNLDHRTDIYSTGIMLYQLICGRLPFESIEGTEYQIMMAHVNEPPPAFEKWSLDVSPDLETAIFKALAKKRADRFNSAFDFANALKNINLSLGIADYLRIGRSHFQDRRFHEASSFFSRVLKLKPNHTESTQALRQIELCKGFIGNVNKAIKMLETDNFSEFHDTYEMLSRQYRKNQNLEAVLSEYQTELDRQRTSKIHALIHEASNAQNSNIAKQHYADCLKLDPENQAARRAFAGNIKKDKKQAPKGSKKPQQTAGLPKPLLFGIGFIIFITIGLVIYFVIAQPPNPEPTTYLTPGQADNQSDLLSPEPATSDKSDSLVNSGRNMTGPTSNPLPIDEPEQGTLVFNTLGKTTEIRINGDIVLGTRVERPPGEYEIECFQNGELVYQTAHTLEADEWKTVTVKPETSLLSEAEPKDRSVNPEHMSSPEVKKEKVSDPEVKVEPPQILVGSLIVKIRGAVCDVSISGSPTFTRKREVDVESIRVGNHIVNFQTATYAFPFKREVTIEPGKQTVLDIQLHKVTIGVRGGANATIEINGESIGRAPIVGVYLPTGKYTFKAIGSTFPSIAREITSDNKIIFGN